MQTTTSAFRVDDEKSHIKYHLFLNGANVHYRKKLLFFKLPTYNLCNVIIMLFVVATAAVAILFF